MRRLGRIFNIIMVSLGLRKPFRPEDIPKKLDADTLEKVMLEARFLHFQGVDVKMLAPDEEPQLPRPVDESVVI